MRIKDTFENVKGNADNLASKLKEASIKKNIVMPERYKKINKQLPKDLNIPKDTIAYGMANDGTNALVVCVGVSEEASMDFDDPNGLIEKIHNEMCSEETGLIEVKSGIAAAGGKYIYHIMKTRKTSQDGLPLGVAYSVNFNIQIRDTIQFLNGSFEEVGATGMRDALVMAMQDKLGNPTGLWQMDPYDESFKKGFLMNWSEQDIFDEMFPEHPLSEARKLIQEIIEYKYDDSSQIEKLANKAKKQTEAFTKAVEKAGKAGVEAFQEKFNKENSSDESSKTNQSEKSKEESSSEKKEKLDDSLRFAVDQYNNTYALMNDHGNVLYMQRERSVDVIQNIENLINSIANHPKEFDKEIEEIVNQRKEFKQVAEYAKEELEAAQKSAMSAGAGVAGGAAVVSLAPSAAMWIATTFGTASTGTAISTLSGAAATNAALAWLGGGTVAMGGGGMAGGTAFLALAGPVGWGIAGATLLTSVALFANKKLKLDKQKKEEIESVLNNTEKIREVDIKIKALLDKTESLRDSLNEKYRKCLNCFNKDYNQISENEQYMLGTLVNETKALTLLLGEGVE